VATHEDTIDIEQKGYTGSLHSKHRKPQVDADEKLEYISVTCQQE
jgi:hypothetical protein